MSKQLKNQHGSALVIALFLVVIISIFGVALISVSSNSLKQVDYERRDQAVFYIAEAGMNLAKLEVKKELIEIQRNSYQQITDWIASENQERKVYQLPRLTKAEAEAQYRSILNNEFTMFNNVPPISNSHAISSGKVATISIDTALPTNDAPLLYRINIVSEGSIDGARERIVTQEIEIEPRLPFAEDGDSENDDNGENGQPPGSFPDGYAAIVSGNIILGGSGSINGGAASKEGNISLTGTSTGRISGDVSIQNIQNISIPREGRNDAAQESFIHSNYTIVPNLNIDPKSYLSPTFFPDDKFLAANSLPYAAKHTIGDQWNRYDVIDNQGNYNAPAPWRDPNYTLNLSNGSTSVKFKNFNVNTGDKFIINVGDNREVDLYIDNLNITNGKIYIEGSGKLNIYATNITNFNGPFNQNPNNDNQPGDSSQLTIYHQGSSQLSLSNHSKISGTFINKSSNMTLTGGAAIYGNIVSGGRKITISGGVPTNGQYIIAPNAKLDLSGGGNITGIVVVDSIDASGGTRITYGGPATPLPPGVVPETEITEYPTPNIDDDLFWIDETSMIEN
ncbi:pilus assembly PilX N-terminal domain-containing protein [Metasolibacillus meyeri]|uniref:Pilus assembly PilX N-terminal domain-containing protein n=1 Tax=Metasolibacillus meyeri TaxID=1071052 RepID=A0AAW9NVJ5_9BACL|nr:pilus assembly PilX N-terminal domain-containing protein [Metasolibacillus meyeri]MEC1179251.1 pilus assembly PilX N-terminal domain-containing protein [Metasolibacillus meyeri]